MLNREKVSGYKISYSNVVDDYGQRHVQQSKSEPIEIVIKRFSNQLLPTNPIYNDVEYIGLTKSKVSDANDIVVNSKTYKVLFTIDAPTMTQAFLKIK